MKNALRITLFLSILLFQFSISFTVSQVVKQNEIVGVYTSKKEILYIQPNNAFFVKRILKSNDVISHECNDTIAYGTWELSKQGDLKLHNNVDFNKVFTEITQKHENSNDSIYIKIMLPNDPAFFEGRFQFELFFWYGIGNYETFKNFIVLPKKKITNSDNYTFSLTIKDTYPNCEVGRKCYQRIYFKVLDRLKFGPLNNFTTISLTNFNNCFVERMDLDNEILVVNNNDIYWRGNVYKKQ